MKRHRHRRNQWKNYAAATAGIVGSAVGMETNVARADLVHDVNPDLTIGVGETLFLDLDQQGPDPDRASMTDFSGSDLRLINISDDNVRALLFNITGELLAFSSVTLRRLPAGYTIDAASYSWAGTQNYLDKGLYSSQWEGGGEGFLGVRLDNGGGHNYGWVHLTYDDTGNTLTLHAFAINEIVDDAIVTAVIPEAQSLAACSLALGGVLGAQGVLAYRRRKKELATA